MINAEEVEKLMALEGRCRGAVFQTDGQYIINQKGRAGMEKIKELGKKIGQPIPYGKEVQATRWYPLGWRVISLLMAQEVFGWGERDLFDMGCEAPKKSFIIKTILRYFISIEKTFAESSKYWEKHYSVGFLTAPEISEEEKTLVLRLEEFNVHPILCPYFRGYFKGLANLVIRTDKITIKETKCPFKEGGYHEFVIKWE